MHIGIVTPYLDTLTGGERYMMTAASHWSKCHAVTVFWNDGGILKKVSDRFCLDTSRIHIRPDMRSMTLLGKLRATHDLDILFALSDGSVPVSFARRNILHLQVPVPVMDFPLWKRMQWKAIIVNSRFTKDSMDPRYRQMATVVYPPVRQVPGADRKKKIVLSVGRLSDDNAKKYDRLIGAWIGLTDTKHASEWEYVITGGALPKDDGYVQSLRKRSRGARIRIIPNIGQPELDTLYGNAMLFWHAAGFCETDPVKMEHFGISTVEAMSAGCVPIVFSGGGQREIVTDGTNGFLWNAVDELTRITLAYMTDMKSFMHIARSAQNRARDFSEAKFTESIDRVLYETP